MQPSDKPLRDNPYSISRRQAIEPLTSMKTGGLLTDLIQDMRLVGVTEQQLDPLYKSAEGFIRMWEKVEAMDVDARPTVTATPDLAGEVRAKSTGGNTRFYSFG